MNNEKVFVGIISGAVILLLIVFFRAICADHSVQGYYVGSPYSRAGTVCISAELNWLEDEVVWCTGDIDKAVAITKTLNENLMGSCSGVVSIYGEGERVQ